jgi:hypothetical protein
MVEIKVEPLSPQEVEEFRKTTDRKESKFVKIKKEIDPPKPLPKKEEKKLANVYYDPAKGYLGANKLIDLTKEIGEADTKFKEGDEVRLRKKRKKLSEELYVVRGVEGKKYLLAQVLSTTGKVRQDAKLIKRTASQIVHAFEGDTGQVVGWLEEQPAWQITKEEALPSKYSSFWATEPGKEYQLDLMVYDRYKQDNYQYILCMMDVHSRYVQARAVTNKSADTYKAAIEDMVENGFNKVWPEVVSADQEFNRGGIPELFEKHGCEKFFFSDPEELHKNPLIERFHRTLALRLQRWRQATKESGGDSKRWYKVLPDIIKAYNESNHDTIRAKPSDVFFGRDTNKQVISEVTSDKFSVGDKVRIRLKKKLLAKGDVVKYSPEVYIIKGKEGKQYLLASVDNPEKVVLKKKEYELVSTKELKTEEVEQPQKRAGRERVNDTSGQVLNYRGHELAPSDIHGDVDRRNEKSTRLRPRKTGTPT